MRPTDARDAHHEGRQKRNDFFVQKFENSKAHQKYQNWVVATQIFFYVHPENWGRWTHFDEHIFHRGWFNQQLEKQ